MEVNYKSNVKVLYFREGYLRWRGRIRVPKHDFTIVIMEVFYFKIYTCMTWFIHNKQKITQKTQYLYLYF